MTRIIIWTLAGVVIGFVSSFLISRALGGGSLNLVGASIISFGLLFAVVGAVINEKRFSVVMLLVMIAAIALEGFAISREIKANKEWDGEMRISNQELLQSCLRGAATLSEGSHNLLSIDDCSLLSSASARDFCYGCFARAFNTAGDKVNKASACAKIQDKGTWPMGCKSL